LATGDAEFPYSQRQQWTLFFYLDILDSFLLRNNKPPQHCLPNCTWTESI
jgi:hypothetical protein